MNTREVNLTNSGIPKARCVTQVPVAILFERRDDDPGGTIYVLPAAESTPSALPAPDCGLGSLALNTEIAAAVAASAESPR